jgi:hypothetical protein
VDGEVKERDNISDKIIDFNQEYLISYKTNYKGFHVYSFNPDTGRYYQQKNFLFEN